MNIVILLDLIFHKKLICLFSIWKLEIILVHLRQKKVAVYTVQEFFFDIWPIYF